MYVGVRYHSGEAQIQDRIVQGSVRSFCDHHALAEKGKLTKEHVWEMWWSCEVHKHCCVQRSETMGAHDGLGACLSPLSKR